MEASPPCVKPSLWSARLAAEGHCGRPLWPPSPPDSPPDSPRQAGPCDSRPMRQNPCRPSDMGHQHPHALEPLEPS
eukprot:105820-Chlamydomonas_euryale.AAC.1